MIEFKCACGHDLSVKPEHAGKKLLCPQCKKPAVVPKPDAEPEPALPKKGKPASSSPSSPGTSRITVRKGSEKGWKLMAAVGMLIGVVSLVISAVLATSKPEPPPPSPDTGLIELLRRDLQDRDEKIRLMESKLAELGDSDQIKENQEQIETLNEERKQLLETLSRTQIENQRLQQRIRELEATAAKPPPAPEKTEPKEKSITELVEAHAKGVVVIRTNRASGAGFFIAHPGWVVTNYHVVAGSSQIRVECITERGGRKYRTSTTGQVHAVDAKNDLALVVTRLSTPPHCLTLGLGTPLRVGEAVIAIGNPGVGDRILEYSVSNGILSSAERQLEDRAMLQTTAAINPGNSGGPLLDMSGNAIGVVTAKAIQQENIGFATPIRFVKALFDGRDGVFSIGSSLTSWEAKHRPKMIFTHDTSNGIAVGSVLRRLQLHPDGKRLLGLDTEQNSLVIISLPERKVLSTIFTGSEPADYMFMTSAGKSVLVANQGSKEIVRVDLAKGEIVDKWQLEESPVQMVEAKRNYWFITASRRLRAFSPYTKKGYAVPRYSYDGLGYDSRLNLLVVGTSGRCLHIFDPSKLLYLLREHTKYAVKNDQATRTRRMQIEQQIEKSRKSNVFQTYGSSYHATMLTPSQEGMIIYNRALFDTKKLDAPRGIFKPNPYSRNADAAVRLFMAQFPQLDQVLAVSPDGRWAANGTHLFSAERFTVAKEMPLPIPSAAFSADSKTLYFSDVINKMVVPMEVE